MRIHHLSFNLSYVEVSTENSRGLFLYWHSFSFKHLFSINVKQMCLFGSSGSWAEPTGVIFCVCASHQPHMYVLIHKSAKSWSQVDICPFGSSYHFPDVSHSFQKLAPLLNVTQRYLYLSIQPSIFPCQTQNCGERPSPPAFLTFHELPAWIWDRGYLASKVGNMATSQKAFVIVTHWADGIHFCHVLPISSPRPLAAPKSRKGTLLSFAFSAASLFPSWENNISQKKSKFLSFCLVSRPKVLFIVLHSLSIHRDSFWWNGKCFIFTNMQSRIVSLINCLFTAYGLYCISCGVFKWDTFITTDVTSST